MKEILNNSWLIIVCLLVGSALFMGAVTASLYMINYPSTIVFYTGCIMLIMTIASYIYWMNAGALKLLKILGENKPKKTNTNYKNKENVDKI